MRKNKRVFAWQYMDGKKIFKYYWEEMGTARSCSKLAKWCKSEGMSNPITGKSPTTMAVWFSMWRWAIRNQTEAYQIYNKALSDLGLFISDVEWKVIIDDKASVCLNKKSYDKFRREYGYTS